jgi:GMP synthase-like glutamine amidotransferase
MILVVDLSWKPHSLSCSEFAGPVSTIVGHAGGHPETVHFSAINNGIIGRADGIILCGTALEDNCFASRADEFSWLLDVSVPVLGICAGMQVLCKLFGGTIYTGCEIGMTEISVVKTDPLFHEEDVFMAYELHSFASNPPEDWAITAVSDGYVQAVHHPDRPIFGLMFHPEVRHEDLIMRFLTLCREETAIRVEK